MDAERIDYLDAIDFLGRDKRVGLKDPRVLFGAITQPDDGTIDDLLVQAPDAVNTLLKNNDPRQAQSLLQNLDSRIGGITGQRNWGYKVEGHHPIAIGGSYLLTSDMSMAKAQAVYDVLRLNGLQIGTDKRYMLPITRLAHDLAHIDPITHKTNKRAFQGETTAFRQADPEARAFAYLPMGRLEQALSNAAFNRPEERSVRRFAGAMIARDPELLYALERDLSAQTALGRQRNVTYAQTAKELLGPEQMAAAVDFGYDGKSTMGELILPNTYKKENKRKSGVNYVDPPSVRYVERVNRIGTPVKSALSLERPGQAARMERLSRNRKVAPSFFT